MTQPNNIVRLGEQAGRSSREDSDPVRANETAHSISAEVRPLADLDRRSDPTNVIPFAPLRRDGAGEPPLVLGNDDRPVTAAGTAGNRPAILAFLLGSVLAHAGLLAALTREPPPMASIGLEAISVDIVLGTAGTSEAAPSPPEVQATPAPANPQPPEPPNPIQEAAVKPDAKLDPAPPAPEHDAAPPPATEPPPNPVAVAPPPPPEPPKKLEPERAIEPRKPVEQPTPQKPVAKPIPRDTTAKPQRPAPGDNKRVATAPAATPMPGRSETDTNYRGLAAAHLARFKQFPADARSRGDHGSSVVTFSIDGSGRVTGVSLVRGTGIASLDQESQAMVRRASPFPPPPGGRSMTITAPVNFHLR